MSYPIVKPVDKAAIVRFGPELDVSADHRRSWLDGLYGSESRWLSRVRPARRAPPPEADRRAQLWREDQSARLSPQLRRC
jgi:hypothetical protein